MSRGAIDIKVLQTLNPERKRHCFCSAGACPPRVFDPNEKRRLERSAGACLPRVFDPNEKRRLERSAGACPPRSLRRNEKRPKPKRPRTFVAQTGAWRGTGPRPTVNGDGFLLPNDHLPRCGEIARGQRIEIDTACNGFSLCIPAIPIRRTMPTVITPRTPMPEV